MNRVVGRRRRRSSKFPTAWQAERRRWWDHKKSIFLRSDCGIPVQYVYGRKERKRGRERCLAKATRNMDKKEEKKIQGNMDTQELKRNI